MIETARMLVKMAEFARMQGWNRSTVTRLRHAGRLVIENGLVNVAASLDLIAATADARRDDVAARHAAARLQKTQKQAVAAVAQPVTQHTHTQRGENGATAPSSASPGAHKAAQAAADADAADAVGSSFQASRAMKEKYLALQAQAEYQRIIGELLPRADVIAALDDVVAIARQGLENLPHRTAPRLYGKELDAIRAVLREDIGALMREMHADAQRQLAQLTQGDGDGRG